MGGHSMSNKSRNKRIASLLTGASLSVLSLVGGGRSAAAVTITGPGPFTNSVTITELNITGPTPFTNDVVNNGQIGPDETPVVITAGVVFFSYQFLFNNGVIYSTIVLLLS